MPKRIKFGVWTVFPVILGILVAYFAFSFFENVEYVKDKEVIAVSENKIVEKKEKVKEPDFVTLIFGGDIMMDRGVRRSVEKNFAGDYAKIFENEELLQLLQNADIAFGNLEGTASDKGKDLGGKFSFHMDPAIVPVLKDAGIDILSVANNHVGDWGQNAYIDNMNRLKDGGILFTGGGMNRAEAEVPTIIEKNGIKIGFLAFSDVGPSWMEVTEKNAGLLIASSERSGEIIKNASAQVDYLIVSFHFGDEYKTIHNNRQEYLAHKAVDNGAKLVIGHHPHVPQDMEVYKGGFIAYSLGNFIFDQSWSEPTMRGLLLEVKLNKDGSMTTRRNDFKLNKFLQPGEIIRGEEEKTVF